MLYNSYSPVSSACAQTVPIIADTVTTEHLVYSLPIVSSHRAELGSTFQAVQKLSDNSKNKNIGNIYPTLLAPYYME